MWQPHHTEQGKRKVGSVLYKKSSVLCVSSGGGQSCRHGERSVACKTDTHTGSTQPWNRGEREGVKGTHAVPFEHLDVDAGGMCRRPGPFLRPVVIEELTTSTGGWVSCFRAALAHQHHPRQTRSEVGCTSVPATPSARVVRFPCAQLKLFSWHTSTHTLYHDQVRYQTGPASWRGTRPCIWTGCMLHAL